MNSPALTADRILELVDSLSPQERARLVQRLREREAVGTDPAVEASFEEARRITAKFKGSLADAIVTEREDRDI